MKILIKNGKIIDPGSGIETDNDILIYNGIITQIAANIQADNTEKLIDATGCIILPGLIDMHAHFREPGREDIETIRGGSEVAAKAGFTTVCLMPNTTPFIDSPSMMNFVKKKAEDCPINVLQIANITKNSEGKELTLMKELAELGAVGFSDDGLPVMNALMMRKALEYSANLDMPVITHSEDTDLSDKGVMNEGQTASLLGLKGVPSASEEIMIARDAILAKLTGGRLHIAHVSSAGSVEIIRLAKERGVKITCEATPHHFSLNEEAVKTHLSMAKMSPPLRTEADRLAIIEGLRSGVIDALATDHAPHLENDKMKGMKKAPFGIIGLETAVPLIVTKLVMESNFSYAQAFKKLTFNPAGILKLPKGSLKENHTADITIINPSRKVHIDKEFLVSKCKNSPFIGLDLYGSVEYTICGGEIVYRRK